VAHLDADGSEVTGWSYVDVDAQRVLTELDDFWGASLAAGFGKGKLEGEPVLISLSDGRVQHPFEGRAELAKKYIGMNRESASIWLFARDQQARVWASPHAATPTKEWRPFPFWPRRLNSLYGDLTVDSNRDGACSKVVLDGNQQRCSQPRMKKQLDASWSVVRQGRKDVLVRNWTGSRPPQEHQDPSAVCGDDLEVSAYFPSPLHVLFMCASDERWLLWSPDESFLVPKPAGYQLDQRLLAPILTVNDRFRDDLTTWLDLERHQEITTPPLSVLGPQLALGLTRQALVQRKGSGDYWLLDFDRRGLERVLRAEHCPHGMEVLDAAGPHFAVACYRSNDDAECPGCVDWGGLLDVERHRLFTHPGIYRAAILERGLVAFLVAEGEHASLRPFTGW